MSVSPSEGLKRGCHSFNIGMDTGQYTAKNEDAFSYYIHNLKNIKYNVKPGFGYNSKNNRTAGDAFV